MKTSIAIGQIIRDELRRQGKNNRWLAERINVNPRTVNKIFLKNTIDTQQLLLISRALGVDFFQCYSQVLMEADAMDFENMP
ncbi:MAG: helix-turn-helix transcriptional regulator [Muribaculaceae bacterium]|jgi:plasmid maintenance system antidote protein VapI|nr:helix-turn-helix transcriptional regulator [Muribaculaceae bacterium]